MRTNNNIYTILSYRSFVKAFIYLFVFYKLVYPAFVRYFGLPVLPTLISELLILLSLLITVLLLLVSDKKLLTTKKLNVHYYAIGLLLLLIIVSAINNNDNMFLILKSLLGFYMPALLLYFLIMEINLSEKEQVNILKYLFGIILIQIPITLYQAIVINPSNLDSNSGTMSYAELGGTGILSILEAFLVSIFLIAFLYKKFNYKYLLLAVMVLIPAVVGGSRFGLIIIPFVVLISVISFVFYNKETVKKKILQFTLSATIIITIFIAILVLIVPNTKYAHFLNLDIFTSMSSITEYDESAGEYSRMRGYHILFDNYFNSTEDYLIGRGPGSISSSETAGATKSQMALVINLPDAVQIIASLGLSGLALIILIILFPLMIIRQHIRMESNHFFKIVSIAIPSIAVLVVLSLFYAPSWNSQIGIVYWLIIGVISDRYRVFERTLEITSDLSYQRTNLRLTTYQPNLNR